MLVVRSAGFAGPVVVDVSPELLEGAFTASLSLIPPAVLPPGERQNGLAPDRLSRYGGRCISVPAGLPLGVSLSWVGEALGVIPEPQLKCTRKTKPGKRISFGVRTPGRFPGLVFRRRVDCRWGRVVGRALAARRAVTPRATHGSPESDLQRLGRRPCCRSRQLGFERSVDGRPGNRRGGGGGPRRLGSGAEAPVGRLPRSLDEPDRAAPASPADT